MGNIVKAAFVGLFWVTVCILLLGALGLAILADLGYRWGNTCS